MKKYRIHPAIGIARLGNADPNQFFIGPEIPGLPANWDPVTRKFLPFKSNGAVRKQAARFRVWEYDDKGTGRFVPVREVHLDQPDVQQITWTVHLANRKASFFKFDGLKGSLDNFASRQPSDRRNKNVPDAERAAKLEIDAGPKSISGRNAAGVKMDNPRKPVIPIDGLGELRTDAQGRLLVLGGNGQSASLTPDKNPVTDYANNDSWFDDVGDGPVTAKVTVRQPDGSTQSVEADNAWVMVAPPDFAPSVGNASTLYETIWDVAVRLLGVPTNNGIYDEYEPARGLKRLKDQNADWRANGTLKTYKPSFTREIFPIFQRAFLYTQVHAPAKYQAYHYTISEAQWAQLAQLPGLPGARAQIFGWMRDPDAKAFQLAQMPRGLGDNYEDPEAAFPHQFPDSLVSLPRAHFAWLRRWKEGGFESDWSGAPNPAVAAPVITPEGLDRAALETCAGSPFFPGIEASWLIRNPAVYSEPFRIKTGAVVGKLVVGPGFFTQQMALPWQADFYDCHKELYTDSASGEEMFFMWWAAQRPDDVYRNRGDTRLQPWVPLFDYSDFGRFVYMLNNWSKLGFVIEEGGNYFESERSPGLV